MGKWGRYDFCNLEPKKNWEKEFEDEIYCADDLYSTFDKYIGYKVKVKIKCKDGCIQIERI